MMHHFWRVIQAGVSVDTLRYYEKLGVISPKINEENRYRYYDEVDINFIFDYNNYRRLDYSSKEALHFIHEATLEDQLGMLEHKSVYYQDRINRYLRLQERNEEILQQIKHIQELRGKVRLGQSPAFRYITYRENGRFYGFQHYKEELHQWLEQIELTENAVILPGEDLEDPEDYGQSRFWWSLMVREEDYDALQMPHSENVRKIESGPCIRILIESGREGTFHYGLLSPAVEYMKRHHFRLRENPYGILLIRSHDENGIHRYIDFYLPICDS